MLLRPVAEPWRPEVDPADILEWPTFDDVTALVAELAVADLLAIDLETVGTEAWRDDAYIAGIAAAWRTPDGSMGARYFTWQRMPTELQAYLLGVLRGSPARRIAHNLLFDGAWLDRECDRLEVERVEWTYCTYALLKQLGSEGFPGQSAGLKQAQVDLLKWTDTNELEVDEWLLANGYHKQGPKKKQDESPAAHLARIRAWVAENPTKRRVAPDKSALGFVPPDVLGRYAILDTISTMQLFDDVLQPVLQRFPELDEFHRNYFVPMDRILWESTRDGIPIDVEKMEKHAEFLVQQQARAARQMRESPLGPHIRAYEAELRVPLIAAEPPKYKKFDPGVEPARHTKSGAESQSWLKWRARVDRGPEVSKNWLTWRAKLEAAEHGEIPDFAFNPDSTDDLRRVLYDSGLVKWRPTDRTAYKKGKQIPIFEVHGVNGWVDLVGTDSGALPTNGDLYSQLPEEMGNPLQLFADATQELAYADTYVRLAHLHEDGIRRIHPGWISPGTKTLRLAGGGAKRTIIDRKGKKKEKSINLQQLVKTIQFMECLVPEPGQVWPEGDWSAIEPHVLAELSRDPALLKLYGPGAKQHDVYLYSGAHYAVFGEEVRKYYDVENPDVSYAKKHLKNLRDVILKGTYLGKQYGAMWRKLQMTWRLKGYNIADEQAQQISDSHDETYRVSGREFKQKLTDEWEARGGWIMSAHGFPIPIWEGRKKDMINACIQRSAHDCHTMFVVRLDRALRAAGIRFKWIVPDFHDQLILSCATADGSRVLEIIRAEVTKFNAWLGTYVQLKLEPKLSTDMSKAKEAEIDWVEHVRKLTRGWAA